ncbi:MAG: GTPase HflX [Candidatus Methanomethylicaceae archaeon]
MENNAVLIEVRPSAGKSGLPELQQLAEAAGYSVLNTFRQIREYDSSYCLGRGKAEEIAEATASLMPLKIIFNNRLKPIQRYNLTKLFRTEVIDRFQLILEIFTKRAGTKEAKYQIELAKLQYELPMAKENVKMAKLGELPGFHGLGKYQADVYSLMIKKRISYLRRKLEEISKLKSTNRRRRKKAALFTIALSGYTFAGKTTLFNYLAKESLPVGENLFTTLSTTTRALALSNRKILLSDTVGFIDNLPHLLVESFYSTLEEVTLADKVILVLDSSDSAPEFTKKLRTCLSTLNEIGVFNSSVIPVMNKADMASNTRPLEDQVFKAFGVKPIKISAKTGEGIPALLEELANVLPRYEQMKLKIPLGKNVNSLVSWAFQFANVTYINYSGNYVDLEIEGDPSSLQRFKRMAEGMGGAEMQSNIGEKQ